MTQAIDTSIYSAVTEAIQGEAKRILAEGRVTAIVGYAAARRKGSAQPVVITTADDARTTLRSLRSRPRRVKKSHSATKEALTAITIEAATSHGFQVMAGLTWMAAMPV